MKPTSRPFVVGRRTRKATTLVLLRPHDTAPHDRAPHDRAPHDRASAETRPAEARPAETRPAETRPAEKPLQPIPGPWTLRAMVTATPAP